MRGATTHIGAMLLLSLALAAAGQTAKPAPAKPAATKAKPAAKPAPAKSKAAAKAKPPELQPLSHANKDGFDVLQVAAPEVAEFVAAWKIGGGGKTATTRTVADKPLFTLLLFRGCKADADGKCDVVADFVIHRPDGTTNDENKGLTVWNKAAPSDPKKPFIGDGALGYGVDAEGPFGDYRIVATVTDRVAGVTVTTEQTLTIALGTPTKPAAPAKPAPAKPVAPPPADTPPASPPADPPPADPAK